MDEIRERNPAPYQTQEDEEQILASARRIIDRRFMRQGVISDPAQAGDMIRLRIGGEPREVLLVLYLDTNHGVIAIEEEFLGTLSECSARPRRIVQEALRYNASGIILAHNHPSGTNVPSMSDETFTRALQKALAMFDIRFIDHLVIGTEVTSMARLGVL